MTGGISCADHATPSICKVGTTSPTSGGRSVGIVRSLTKAMEFFLWRYAIVVVYSTNSAGRWICQQEFLSLVSCQNSFKTVLLAYFPFYLNKRKHIRVKSSCCVSVYPPVCVCVSFSVYPSVCVSPLIF
jgi:hypothetical protein